jgi:hypothetical protein
VCSVARWHIFKPKIPIWVNLEGLAMEDVCNFRAILSILKPNGIFYGHLVHCLVIFHRFGILFREKIWQPRSCEKQFEAKKNVSSLFAHFAVFCDHQEVDTGADSRVARCFTVQNTKTGKNVPNYHKIYQIARKMPNGRNIDQTALEYTTIFHGKTLQSFPKLGFLV